MNKETLALILVMGIAGLVILAFVLNDAYGVHEPSGWLNIQTTCFERTTYTQHFISSRDGKPYDKDGLSFDWCIQGLLIDILEENKKQTALLDHIDCMQYENIYGGQFSHKRGWGNCGQPLNYTGVWNP